MDYKIYLRTQRLARFCDFHPEAMLDLVALGEPISIDLLKEIDANNHDLIDKIFNIDFAIKYEFNAYAIGPMETDDSLAIFEFMKNYYGKDCVQDIILEREVLWANFLPFVTRTLFENGKIVEVFQNLVKTKDFEKACRLLERTSKKYRFKIQKSISDKQLFKLFEYAEANLSMDTKDVFDVCYLADKNLISLSVVKAFIAVYGNERKAVKKILRKKGGLEILQSIKNSQVKYILHSLGVR